MKKITISLIVSILFTTFAFAQQNKVAVYSVAFYNLENLFDTINNPDTNDEEFLPDGNYRWGSLKYTNKLKNMAYAISKLATDKFCPNGPAVIGVSEIENRQVLEDLIKTDELANRNYDIVHFDSPDRRGVDVGMLYDRDQFEVDTAISVRLHIECSSNTLTRDQLLVSGRLAGERVHIIVNHWPSRLGGEAQSRCRREAAAALSRHLADSVLAADPNSKVIIMGDLNDDPDNKSCASVLGAVKNPEDVVEGGYFNTMWRLHEKGFGTLGYQGKWNLFDQIIVSANLVGNDRSTLKYFKSEIFNKDFLKQSSGKYKGYPKRTHASGRYLNGYSDHFPVIIYLAKIAQ
ncbi:MAG: endonuclease/exonuclease/phosphatase family protein [Bacteroidaceae bacterium]|nr:endonuclease/exonuclease/phosphatase family protein [Bacteroidaceae bacterium]